ncbi:MAG: rod shape-determining protein MreD [Lachnospiraceae bacterium]|nr:rod shape-determining protein MreD [Lachnospiraceae bacterium]
MIIRTLAILVQALLLYLMQTSVFTAFELAGVVPDLMIILVVAVAYMRGSNKGMLAGTVCGLLMDLTYGKVIGLFALMYMFIGFISGFAHKIYDESDYTIPVFLVGISEFLYNLFYYVFFYFLEGRLNVGYYIFRFMIPRVIYTVLVSLLLYRLLNLENILFGRLDGE